MNQRIYTTLADIAAKLPHYRPDALAVNDAQHIIAQALTPITEVESVTLHAALGGVLATDVISPINVPPHDNSAMDGYALNASSISSDSTTNLKMVGTARAGHAFSNHVKNGECVRIMTGAVMPERCDTVIPIEHVSSASDVEISFDSATISVGANRRRTGEDLAKGSVALARGKLLRPADLGLLASLGLAHVNVIRRLRVAYFSTGDELKSAGEQADEGQLFDSNRYTIYGMLTRLGCEVIDMGIVKDDPSSLQLAFKQAAEQADAIITSGGVSVGDADFTRQMMEELGDIALWQIAMRPGRPLAFGKINNRSDRPAYWFGLPGNPVAVMVSFYFFAQNALLQLMGAQPKALIPVPAHSTHGIRKRAGRTEYQRGIVTLTATGELEVMTTGAQGSGILRSMSEANCMIVLDHDQTDIQAGQDVKIYLFDALI
jgi:molybdopterin molybdotransferase